MYMGNDVITTVIYHTFTSNCVYTNTANASSSSPSVTGISTSMNKVISHATDDLAWHGGCLVIAELARRGLLLPYAVHTDDGGAEQGAHLAVVMPYIMYAMKYDVLKGNHSIGAHVSPETVACLYM